MPPKKRRMNINGEDREVESIPFQAGGEHWNEYMADDGSVIRIKLVVTEILRIDDVYDQEGNPGYLVQSTNVTKVSSPESLRKEGT